jgi:hypothetical protein
VNLKKIVVTATITSALGLGALAMGGVASADPAAPMPMGPGQCGSNWNCQPGPGDWNRGDPNWNRADPNWNRGDPNWNRGDPNWNRGDGNWNRGDGNWNRGDGDWDRGRDGGVGTLDWWRGRQWWRDGDLPPWGFWGQPPAYQWAGAPPWVDPHPFNYWGYNATPVWDPGYNQWGFWLFGTWIPIII